MEAKHSQSSGGGGPLEATTQHCPIKRAPHPIAEHKLVGVDVVVPLAKLGKRTRRPVGEGNASSLPTLCGPLDTGTKHPMHNEAAGR